MRSLARWGTLPLLMAPLGSWALSLGDIEARSYLNQPLNAEVRLSATPDELKGLRVSLAPVSEFTRQQIPYPAFLSSIELTVGKDAAGGNVIQITTPQSISEPFVTLLIQLTGYGRGSLTREYTIFLDPPTFLPDEAAPEPVAPPAARAPSDSGGVIQRPAPAPASPPSPAPAPVQSPAAPAPAVSRAPAAPDGTDYTVAAGDTLWRIAERYRPQGVSTNQAMLSIFDENPAAFDGNINRLRRGAILRIPPAASFDNMSASAATAEVRRQNSEWQASGTASPRLVLRPPSEEAAAGNGAAAGASSSARVSELEDQVSDLEANLSQTEADLDEAKRLLELRDNQLAELQQQVANANASAEAAPAAPPAATETEAATEAAPAAGEAEAPAEEAPVFADDQSATEAPESAAEASESEAETAANAPAEAAAPPPAPRSAPEPSLVDKILGFVTGLAKPLYLGIAGVFVILIGALAFLRRRREDGDDVTGQWEALEAELDDETDHAATARIRARHAAEPDMLVVEGHDLDATAEEPNLGGTTEIEALDVDDVLGGDAGGTADIDAGTAEIDALVMPEPEGLEEPEPETAEQTLSSQTVINLDQADPIAEADFHMAYGLYDQAADLINKALGEDSSNKALKLKLLEVYFVWGNKESFLDSAKAYRADLGAGDWDKVVIMGKQICPDESLFADATAAAGEVDLDLESSGGSAGLDFSFDSGEDEGEALDFALEDSDEIDAGGLSLEASGARATAAGEDDMLDIGAQTQAGLEAALLEEEETDDAGARTTPRLGDDLDDLDATMESPTVETAYSDGSDDFGLTLESPTVEAEGPDSPTVETPTVEAPGPGGLEGGDTVEQPRPESGSATAEMTAEIELDDLGLDVGDIDDLTGVSPSDDEDELLSATGVTQVLHQEDSDIEFTGTAVLGDDDATMMAPGFDAESTGVRTEVLEQSAASYEPEPPETEDDLDLNLDDFSTALSGADTVEQPVPSRFSGLDLDIGGADGDIDDDAPTGTEEMPLDPQTMTEVGTKLDLARAYIDMGDPDGAKSILEEVLTEGDAGQRSEAQALIDALPAA